MEAVYFVSNNKIVNWTQVIMLHSDGETLA